MLIVIIKIINIIVIFVITTIIIRISTIDAVIAENWDIQTLTVIQERRSVGLDIRGDGPKNIE